MLAPIVGACGRNNPDGLYLKSYWDGDEAVARMFIGPATRTEVDGLFRLQPVGRRAIKDRKEEIEVYEVTG